MRQVVAVPDLCVDVSTRKCMEWLAKPNQPHHTFPNRNRMTTMTVDLTVGAEKKCQVRYQLKEIAGVLSVAILVALAATSASRPPPCPPLFPACPDAPKSTCQDSMGGVPGVLPRRASFI